jgi:DNA-binding GntR family transcriptional regulator
MLAGLPRHCPEPAMSGLELLLEWVADPLRKARERQTQLQLHADEQAAQLMAAHRHVYDALAAAPDERVRRAIHRRMSAMGFGRGDTATRMLDRA